MRWKTLVALALAAAVAACERPSPPLPPLLEGAHTTGGANFLCGPIGGEGSTPETASHSPEIVERLARDFPPGTPAFRLREALARQGFQLHPPCSPDGSVKWADFRQTGGTPFADFPAFGTIFWKEGKDGRLVWTTGDIAFTGP